MNQTLSQALDARRATIMAMSRSQFVEAMRRRAWRDVQPAHAAAAAAPPPPPPDPAVKPKSVAEMTPDEFKAAVKARAWRDR